MLCSFFLKRRREPQDLVDEFSLLITDLKRSEAKKEDRQRHLMNEENSCVAPSRCCPHRSQAQEVFRIMRKDDPVLLRGKQELGFVIGAQVARISGREAIHAMLAKHRSERN